MKKLLVIISLIITSLNINHAEIFCDLFPMQYNFQNQEIEEQEKEDSIVNIFDLNNKVVGNGLIFEQDEENTFIMTSCLLLQNVDDFEVVFSNYKRSKVDIIGTNEEQCITVLKVSIKAGKKISYGNSLTLKKGQTINVLTSSKDDSFAKTMSSGIISKIGVNTYKEGNIKRFNTVLNLKNDIVFFGGGVYNQLGLIVGILTHRPYSQSDVLIEKIVYSVDINEALMISKQIQKNNSYKANKFSFESTSLEMLSLSEKKYFGVNEGITLGVVVINFSPFKYIFGGINQGMVITHINEIKVENEYDVHKQLIRYNNCSKVMLKLVNKKGKTLNYETTI